jgi:hypothetical protein
MFAIYCCSHDTNIIQMKAISIWELQFHLPIFFLKETWTGKDSGAEEFPQASCKRSWVLPLTMTPVHIEKSEIWVIQETQFSLAICGLSDYEWIAYAFSDSGVDTLEDDRDRSEEIDQEDSDEDDSEDGNDDDISFTEDPIVSDGQQDTKFSRNPREYFLTVIDVRLPRITNHFKDVSQIIKKSVKEIVSLEIRLQFGFIISAINAEYD